MKRDCSTCICKEGSCYPSTTIFDKDKTCKSYAPDYEGYIAELEKENAEMKRDFRICEKNADTYYDLFAKAKEIIEGLMRFCRCFAQHHTEDIRYQEAEQFISEVEK